MTSMVPEQDRLESPGLVREPPAKRRVGSVIAVITALLIGGVGGFFVGRATAPEKTVTKTVTKTITAPAYTDSSAVNATVVFDGTTPGYYGPAELKAGTVVKFTLKAKDPANTLLAVGWVNPGVTWEQASRYTSTQAPPWLNDYETTSPAQNTLTMTVTEGVWDVAVLASPSTANRAWSVTMIRVTR